jgi:xyloglucan fucosyltransferase
VFFFPIQSGFFLIIVLIPDSFILSFCLSPFTDSKNDSSPPAIIPNERLHNGNLPPGFGNGTSSENNSLPHTRGTDMQLNGTLAPGFRKESGSRNDSSQSNRMPDDKLLYGLLAPGFMKDLA